jgi:hypothetical protein
MWPIVGTEAIANGVITRGQLRWNYTAIHPNVYAPNDARRTMYNNAFAAWLWTRRTGIIAGRAAAALYGVDWIDVNTPIELIAKKGRPRPGVIVREERIADDEIRQRGELRITTPARTALDLARRLPRDVAVAHLDALVAKTQLGNADVLELQDRYRETRGIRQARDALDLMDGGARTRKQTWLRLLLIDSGLPRPRTEIVVGDKWGDAIIAMGWDGPKVGVDYEDDTGYIDEYCAVQAINQYETIQRLGWMHIRVVARHTRASIVHRVRAALRERR